MKDFIFRAEMVRNMAKSHDGSKPDFSNFFIIGRTELVLISKEPDFNVEKESEKKFEIGFKLFEF